MKAQNSYKSFGLLFSIVFLIIGMWPLNNGDSLNIYFIAISITFLILGLINSKLLSFTTSIEADYDNCLLL